MRTLDAAPLERRGARALRRGAARRRARDAGARLVEGADVLVHAAAALPIQASRDSIRSVNVEGAAVTLAAALEAGVGRTVLISSTAVYGIPKHHPLREDAPLVGVGHYGESKIEAERVARRAGRRGLEVVILRPKTFIGPERLGVFEILFDWIREGRRIPILGDGSNRYQLLAVEDLVEATVRRRRGRRRRRDVQHRRDRFGTVRSDLEGLIARAGSGSRLRPVPAKPAELARAPRAGAPLALAGGTTAPRAPRLLRRRLEGAEAARLRAAPLERAGALRDVRLVPREPRASARPGSTHRVPWDPRAGRAQAVELVDVAETSFHETSDPRRRSRRRRSGDARPETSAQETTGQVASLQPSLQETESTRRVGHYVSRTRRRR